MDKNKIEKLIKDYTDKLTFNTSYAVTSYMQKFTKDLFVEIESNQTELQSKLEISNEEITLLDRLFASKIAEIRAHFVYNEPLEQRNGKIKLAEMLDNIHKKLTHLIEMLNANKNADGWISVKDNPPKLDKRVLVYVDDLFIGQEDDAHNKIVFGYLRKSGMKADGCYGDYNITHWKPLGELPEETPKKNIDETRKFPSYKNPPPPPKKTENKEKK